MKTYILILSILIISCTDKQTSITPEKADEISTIAKPAATELIQQLKGALIRTIEDSGIVAAIEVCKNIAPEISRSVANKMQNISAVGRTSLNVRNTSNSPDVTDLLAMRYFEEKMRTSADSLPSSYILDDGTFYRYYQPLLIQPLCLNCHGDKSMIQKEVVSVIEKNYPQDRAYGYKLNDFRGLIRVKIFRGDQKF